MAKKRTRTNFIPLVFVVLVSIGIFFWSRKKPETVAGVPPADKMVLQIQFTEQTPQGEYRDTLNVPVTLTAKQLSDLTGLTSESVDTMKSERVTKWTQTVTATSQPKTRELLQQELDAILEQEQSIQSMKLELQKQLDAK